MNNKSVLKSWKEATFTNSFIFAAVLSENMDITKELISLFNPELHIKEISLIEDEKPIQFSTLNKYIRLDILATLDDGTLVNVEMQMNKTGNISKRLRYYSSLMDLNALKQGEDYDILPNKIIMMVCNFDLFKLNKPIYEFKMRTDDTPSIELMDGSKILILNTKGNFSNMDNNQKAFLNYVSNGSSSIELTDKIDKAVYNIKSSTLWRDRYMRLEIELNEKLKEGMELGFKSGKEEGFKSGKEIGFNNGKEIQQKQDILKTYVTLKEYIKDENELIKAIENTFDVSKDKIIKILNNQKG